MSIKMTGLSEERRTTKRLNRMELAEINAMASKSSRKIKYIVVHCSATQPTMEGIDAAAIDSWHRAKGWSGIGYHFVITRAGEPELGRNIGKVGAHVKGHNANSIGICMVGGVDEYNDPECNFEEEQYVSLFELIKALKEVYPQAKVLGHRDFKGVKKACPCFNAIVWWDECIANEQAVFPIEQAL